MPESYPTLRDLRVGDAMHPGLVSCSVDTPLRDVARMMATYRVHAILVTAHDGEVTSGQPWGVVSDLDLLRAAETADVAATSAREVAGTPVVMVAADQALAHAAGLMAEREVSHLLVVEPQSRRPFGVISTLDLARALAGFPERHPS
ncbi:MAG TPA: CBS domain-containing protein [Gaiellaceae bacterium]|nr:CBS domain-containing protein [Gaiellaceae bacterium]